MGLSKAEGLTKHELIIRYIKALQVETKISVRQIAKELKVSEGTAYRAIKEAEAQGLVSSIPKVGTIRIESQEEKGIEALTLGEVAKIIEGKFLTSCGNLRQAPANFVIASYSPPILKKFLVKNSLLFVGDQPEIQELALGVGAHLVVTAALEVKAEIKQKAARRKLQIISCPYDIFEAVAMLNRAIYERLKDRELVYVEDIMVGNVFYLRAGAVVADWYKMAEETGHSRFPVVDKNMRVVGMVTAVDVAGAERGESVLAVMTKDVLTVELGTLLAHLSRVLIWEGFELVPIVQEKKLVGVISRQDILTAFQQTQKQPHVGDTVDNIVMSGFKLMDWEKGIKLSGEITEFMINEEGTASPGTLVTIISTATYIVARKKYRLAILVQNLNLQQVQPLAVGDQVEVYAQIVHLEKKACLTDVGLYCSGRLKAKALVSARIVKK